MKKNILILLLCVLGSSFSHAFELSPNQISFGSDSTLNSSFIGTGWKISEDITLPVHFSANYSDKMSSLIAVSADLLFSIKKSENIKFYYGAGVGLSSNNNFISSSISNNQMLKALIGLELTFSEFKNIGFNVQSGLLYKFGSPYEFSVFAENPFVSNITYYF